MSLGPRDSEVQLIRGGEIRSVVADKHRTGRQSAARSMAILILVIDGIPKFTMLTAESFFHSPMVVMWMRDVHEDIQEPMAATNALFLHFQDSQAKKLRSFSAPQLLGNQNGG